MMNVRKITAVLFILGSFGADRGSASGGEAENESECDLTVIGLGGLKCGLAQQKEILEINGKTSRQRITIDGKDGLMVEARSFSQDGITYWYPFIEETKNRAPVAWDLISDGRQTYILLVAKNGDTIKKEILKIKSGDEDCGMQSDLEEVQSSSTPTTSSSDQEHQDQ